VETESIHKAFRAIGAKVDVHPLVLRPWERDTSGVRIDVLRRNGRQQFDIARNEQIDIRVVDVRPDIRHVLLLCVHEDGRQIAMRFLCGHDEKEWFAAAVPIGSNVDQAFDALKPDAVKESEKAHRVKWKHRNKRKTKGFVRQGEWFFVPAPDFDPGKRIVHHKEPLQRGRGRPHIVDELVRIGGQTVQANRRFPNGLTEEEFAQLIRENPDAAKWHWENRVRNPSVYVRGRISQPGGHRTVILHGWHRVLVNRESEAPGFRGLAFLD
jgi:hypothetical protein